MVPLRSMHFTVYKFYLPLPRITINKYRTLANDMHAEVPLRGSVLMFAAYFEKLQKKPSCFNGWIDG